MKKIINKILLLTLFLAITTGVYIINPFFAYTIDENGIYHIEKNDFQSSSSAYQNVYKKYFNYLYDNMGYEIVTTDYTTYYSISRRITGLIDDFLTQDSKNYANNVQIKSKWQSIINEYPDWFNKINNSSEIIIKKSMISIKRGQTYTLETNTTNKVKWSSSNKKIASINKNGVIKAKKTGVVIITAKDSVTGSKAYCKVYVYTKNKNNVVSLENRIINAALYYQKKEGVDLNGTSNNRSHDYSCGAFDLLIMNKVMGSNNYIMYSNKNYKTGKVYYGKDYITGKEYYINVSKKMNSITNPSDIKVGDIIAYYYSGKNNNGYWEQENHSVLVLENNGNSIKVVDTNGISNTYRRISYNFFKRAIKGKGNFHDIIVHRHKKIA